MSDDIDMYELTADDDIYEGEVSCLISVCENATTFAGSQFTMPQVLVTCKYPDGVKYINIPMFSTDLDGAGLEQVRRVDSDTKLGPEIHAIYRSDQMDRGWARVIRRPGVSRSGVGEIEIYEYKENVRDEETVMWDAEWEETTDPLLDISLAHMDDDELADNRCTRPWEEEE